MARDYAKQKLSKSILEMKFMKRSKEKALKEQETEQVQAKFADVITEQMKHGACKYIIEPSYVPCEDLIIGRLASHGMNPEIERILEEEKEAKEDEINVKKEMEVSDDEMAERYSTLVGTIGRKFKTKNTLKVLNSSAEEEEEPKNKKVKFMKPSDD